MSWGNWRLGQIEIGEDIDGDATQAINLPTSKTSQFNQCEKNVLKTLQSGLRHVRMFARWETLTAGPASVRSSVFGHHLRTRLAVALRLAGAECHMGGSRLGAHFLRSGGVRNAHCWKARGSKR